MNKIYKVMYSKVKQCCVVVSEIAKSHGRHTKSSIAKSSAALTAGVLIALGSFSFEGMPVVQAADGTESLRNNDFVGANDQYWYYDEDAKEWKTYQYKLTSAFNNRSRGDLPNYQGGGAKLPGAITAGLYAQAGQQTVTIGDRNAGESRGSVFIGEHSGYDDGGKNSPTGASNNYVTSVGFQSDATGWGSIAIGSNAIAENSKMNSDTVKEEGNYNTTGTVRDDTYSIEANPTIDGASVALGYNAHSKDGNIAIGANSDATSTDGGDSYLSVGSETLKRRITNVAQGTGDPDVVTLGQMNEAIKKTDASNKANIDASNIGNNLTVDPVYQTDEKGAIIKGSDDQPLIDEEKTTAKRNEDQTTNKNAWGAAIGTGSIADPTESKDNDPAKNGSQQLVTGGTVYNALQQQADNLKVNAGWGINVANENDPKTGAVTKKNVISLKHNLGTGYNDDEAKGMIIGGLVEDRDSAKQYGAADANSVIVGAGNALASGKSSVVVGGLDNVASGATSVVIGGDNNNAEGNQSAVFGGRDNTAAGIASTASGGIMNAAVGQQATAIGGSNNYVLGANATAVGGLGRDYANGEVVYDSAVRGSYSVGIAGGSTGEKAIGALAAGHQAVVTTENGTAIGYQATTDEANTIAFGHDADDVSGYTIEWNKLPEGQVNADGTANDYTKAPKSVTPTTYKDAYYNRLVKVADGIDDHDVVVMEQLNNAKNDLKVNAGWGIKVNDVTTKNADDTKTTTKNVISLNRNLGTNYGNPWKGEGKVTFEAGGENSLILGGAASILQSNENDDVKAGANGKDSVLVGGFNNLIDTVANDMTQTGENAVIVGGDTNKVTGLRSVIIGGYQNNVSGGHSVVVGGASNEADGGGAGVFGGQSNKAAGEYSSVLGGDQNEADGGWSSAIGGTTNIASGRYATVLGGVSNDAKGNESAVVGGTSNVAIGEDSTVNGGAQNTSYGTSSYAAGGMNNMAFGNVSVALGGQYSSVNGISSTGIAGGSTGENAMLTLAAGYQSVVTDSGVKWRPITQDEADKINQGKYSWPGFSGKVDYGDGSSSPKVLDRISTAVGYQSTADAPGVIAFGHDKGDVASVAKKWKQKATEKDGKYYDANDKEISDEDYYKLVNADGTWNDYTQDPIGTENTTYQSAYYNRLVKAADGIDAHDAVVMEQLKPYTKSDASNVGANLKTYTVGDDGETITEADATPEKQKENKDAWGKALGADPFTAGTTAAATNASTSDQLVTGKTLYNYDAPVAETGKNLNYVSANNTTGQNLSALDAQVKANADKGLKFAANSGAEYTAKLGSTVKIQGIEKKEGHEYTADNLTTEIDGKGNITILMDKNVSAEKIAVNGKDGKEGAPGTPGSIGISGQDGQSSVGIDGKDGISIKGRDGKDGVTMKAVDGEKGTEGHIGLTGPAGTNGIKGADGQPGTSIDITVKNGYNGANGVNGKNGVDGTSLTRIVYTDGAGEHQVATMEDGLKFKGDDGTEIAKKLNNTMEIIGGADSTKLTDKNIGVNSDGDKLKVQLSKDLTGMNSTTYTTTTGEGESATTSTTVVNGNGLTITDGPSITNKGIDGGKKVITNVGSGIEKDTNGKYTVTDQNKGNAANIGDVQNMVNDAKKDLTDGANGLNNKANIDASNIGANLKNAEDRKANAEKWGSAIGTGEIKADDGRMVTGKTVYDEVRPTEDGSYVKKNQTTGENLSALDSKIGKLDETKKYNYIDSGKDVSISNNLTKLDTQVKDNADAITNINQSISTLDQNAVKYDDSSKSKISLGGEGGTTITNVKAGVLSENSSDAVNGGQLWQVDQKVDTNTTNITKNAGDITNLKNLSNITDAGKTVIKNLSKDAVQVKAGDRIKVDETTDDKGNKTYTISANNNGTVEKDDGNLISGGTLYNEVRPTEDGNYVKKDKTAGQNLSALDSALKTTSDLIHTNTAGDTIQIGGNSTATKIDVRGKDKDGKSTGRIITGVVTDAADPTSAANVGYVNGVTAANTQQIYRDMNNAYGRLNNNINKAAAGSNALAALHPLDYDPDDKADFAVGYGHYRNANAAAVGAFYHPNENTMVNVGVSMGNGDPGFNAGVSFKVGRGGAGREAMSRTEMAKVIKSQSKEIDALKKDNADKDKRIDALEQKMAEILAKLDKNGK